MKKSTKIALAVICGSLLALSVAFLFFILPFLSGSNAIDNINPIAKSDMLETTLVWGRLASLPDSKSDFDIQTEGSAFTRSFRSHFYLPKEDLEEWIAASPGLSDAEIETVDGHKKIYSIEPGGGAVAAEAVIDFDSLYVELYVSWS